MTNNDENHSGSSAQPHLSSNSRVQLFFRRLSKKFEDLASAVDGNDDEHLSDRITAVEQRIAVLETQKAVTRQNGA